MFDVPCFIIVLISITHRDDSIKFNYSLYRNVPYDKNITFLFVLSGCTP